MIEMADKRKTLSIRKVTLVNKLHKYFLTYDRPLSYSEILDHTNTWGMYSLTGGQLSNILIKSKLFNLVGTTTKKGFSHSYKVNLYELSDEGKESEMIHVNRCMDCNTIESRTVKKKKIVRCGRCYIRHKRAERTKNGEA